ncbi:MAG: hypothetical protein ACYTA5_07575 [Planctomycetota bacterium]|jgi:hypothetical protein
MSVLTIETSFSGQILRFEFIEMPFAGDRSSVAGFFQGLRQYSFIEE